MNSTLWNFVEYGTGETATVVWMFLCVLHADRGESVFFLPLFTHQQRVQQVAIDIRLLENGVFLLLLLLLRLGAALSSEAV